MTPQKPLCELTHIEALAALQAAEAQIAWLMALMAQPKAPARRGLKPGTVVPTTEEDAAITSAAMQDPDARPHTDEEWAVVRAPAKRRARSVGRRPDDAAALPLPPLYDAVMAEIRRLMSIGEAHQTPDDDALLDALVDVAMVYEQCCLPGWLFPEVDRTPPPPPEGE